jgi:hypothetical protein
MRVRNNRVNDIIDPALEEFDSWTLSIGDGLDINIDGQISIPEQHYFRISPNTNRDKKAEERSMKAFCDLVYHNLATNINTPGYLDGKCVLAPTNKEVDTLNELLESRIPGNPINLSSADSLEDYRDVMRFNTEYLNTLTPN